MKILKNLFTVLIIFGGFDTALAQSCVSTGLNGTVINLPCGGTCTPMSFKVPHLKSTSNYTIVSIPFTPLPFSSATATEVTSIYSDDQFSVGYPLPFPFCFYDSTFTQFVVGSNGVLSFDLANANCKNAWKLQNTSGGAVPIPFVGTGVCSDGFGPKYPKYSIMSPMHDIDPGILTSANRKIEWRVEGSAPCRKLVVNFLDIVLFGDNSKLNTSQIIMYESTGLIEIFIKDKELDATQTIWNGNLAILGLQKDATTALPVPGKNATIWNENNMGYRFIPSGATSRFIKSELYDFSNNLLATTGPTDTATTVAGVLDVNFSNVCPPGLSAQYIIKTYFASCADSTQLISSDTVTVNKTTSLGATIINTTPAACGPNGSITINIPTGAGILPYTLIIDGGTPVTTSNQTYTFNNVFGGPHIITISSTGGCLQTLNPTVGVTGVLAVTPVINATTCNGASDGSVTINPTNGVAPYQYSLNGNAFQNSNTFSNLPAGSYQISVKDLSGCQLNNYPVTIAAGPPLAINIVAAGPACAGTSSGLLTVTPTTGVGPYQYMINPLGGGFQSNNVFSNLPTGAYFISATSANGCFVNNVPFNVPVATATLATTITSTATSCTGVNNGSINIVPLNGTAPFQYSLDGGVSFITGLSITNLAAGNYPVIVKDNLGCTSAPVSVTVNAGQPLAAIVSVNNVLCNGGNNGNATINITGNGTPPFQYSLDGITWQASNVFSGLTAGNYTVQFKENNNCTGSQSFTIIQPTALSLNANTQAPSCNGQSNGTITAFGSGGTPPYQFSIDGINYQSSPTFNVAASTYPLYVNDAHN